MVIKDDRPYILDSAGRLRVFDGTSFIEIARLPIKDETIDNFNDNSNDRWIHPNGMAVADDEIYCLIRNTMSDSTDSVIEQMPSGVWSWNQENGFYCKYTFSNTGINTGTSPTLLDFGTTELLQVGGLFKADATGGQTVNRTNESDIMAGLVYYTNATATQAAVGITDRADSIQKAGYFVTAQANAESFDETWKEVVAVHDRMKNSTDRIILKYRTHESTPIYGTATWSNDLLLRTTTDLSTIEQGDEIEILRGTGSGTCFSVKNITNPADYRVTLDCNPLAGMTGTCTFRAQKWKLIGTADTLDEMFIRKGLDAKRGAWVQFKVFLIGTGRSPQLIKLLSSSDNASIYK